MRWSWRWLSSSSPEKEELLEGLGINFNFLLSQIVNFLILFIALYFLLWKRVLNFLDARKKRIQEGLEKAEQADQELARAKTAYGEKVAQAEAEAQRIRAEALAAAEQERARVLEAAREEAVAIQADARAHLDLERQRMLDQVCTELLARASAYGFTVQEVYQALGARVQEGGDST